MLFPLLSQVTRFSLSNLPNGRVALAGTFEQAEQWCARGTRVVVSACCYDSGRLEEFRYHVLKRDVLDRDVGHGPRCENLLGDCHNVVA